jgi:hypothetical protein
MSEYPEFVIFRPYAALAFQNIVYLQEVLQGLESEFRTYPSDDMISGIEYRM